MNVYTHMTYKHVVPGMHVHMNVSIEETSSFKLQLQIVIMCTATCSSVTALYHNNFFSIFFYLKMFDCFNILHNCILPTRYKLQDCMLSLFLTNGPSRQHHFFKFIVTDLSVTINISFINHFIHFLLCQLLLYFFDSFLALFTHNLPSLTFSRRR